MERVPVTIRTSTFTYSGGGLPTGLAQGGDYLCASEAGHATELSTSATKHCMWIVEYAGAPEEAAIHLRNKATGWYAHVDVMPDFNSYRPVMAEAKSTGNQWTLHHQGELEGGGDGYFMS